MEQYKLFVYLTVIGYSSVRALGVQIFGPQPRIISASGHLIFNSADNKNIHFLTKGNGKIMLNGADLTDATSLVRNASATINRVNSELHDTYFQVKRFKILLEGRQGILERLHMIETGGVVANISYPGAIGGSASELTLTVLNRRFRVLQRRVNRLLSLLTRNECSSNPCKNGGTCQDLFNGFICICPAEWEGFHCDKDVNECARFAGTDLGCQNGATCINKPGSYECVCTTGWFGIHCTRGTNSCSSGSVAELCGHGMCIPQNGGVGYKCICDQGWTTDEKNVACTKDVDECVMSRPPCSTNPPVPCVNTPGSFSCGNCPLGYTGNGYYCTDLDECALFNGGCSMDPLVQCINTPGSRVCGMCPPGYIGDGASCSFKGSCGINNGGCHYLALCRENPRISSTFVECLCAPGYHGSGIGPSGCVLSLAKGDPCANNPCINGICLSINSTGTYICICNKKFTGKNCDIRKDPCQSNPCYNGGTCISYANSPYKCLCTAGYTGDRCDIERQACGGRLVQESGILKYPATQSVVHSHLISCAWIIETNASKVLNITFTNFHLDASQNCRFDWLQIHDGRNSASQSLGRFCGNTFPNGGTITSNHNVLYLWFRSDPSISNSGFELKWSSIDPICSETLMVTTHGTLKSPGYPGKYPPNRDCFWTLYAPISKRLQFHFFSLAIGNNPNCSFDYLMFYQGYSTTGRVLAKYCNTSHPEPLYSSGPEVLVHFHSAANNSYPGFQIAYSVVEGIPGCGGVFTTNVGELASPAMDGDYPPDITCEYKIKVHEKSRIKITFLSFELENDETCSNDFLTIHEGSSSKAPLINRYCGNKIPQSFTSSGNEIFIVFSSDWGTNKGGFRLRYETICGGVYSAPSGIIESPGYPNPYSEDQTCIYEIAQPLGTLIQLTFVDFKLETLDQPQCMFDYIEIHDGDSEKAALIGKYCSKMPPIILSSYNYLWLKFESDTSIAASGFQAKYNTTKIGCGGILKTNMGVVRSPEHLKTYTSNTICTWIIVAPPGYVIQLTWLLFRLEQSSTCSFDYVEVYDNHAKREKIGKYCGSTFPPTLMSSSNSLIIKFGTDNSINFDGFMATYSFLNEQSACGGRYFTSSGVIKTPFYPEQYPPNRECVWIITVEKGQQIMLNVTDFFLETVPLCNYDYLELRNGGSSISPLIGRYCGTTIPKQIPSHANQMYITFKSDSSHAFRGFKIYWEATTTGCGGHLTSPRGSIISPYYPEPYSESTVCQWKISVSAGSLIQIIFADIELEGFACLMDYLEIFDGPTIFSPSLGKFCHPISQPFIKSTTNHITLKFRSDASMQQRGFHIQYSTLCQNTVKGFRGVIESPNFPNSYPKHQDCLWKIQVPLGNKINISFSHFEIETMSTNGTENCRSNYVQIKYNNENEELFTKGTYCGTKIPPLISLMGNTAEIRFVSDEFAGGIGFRLEWQIVGCGGRVTHPSGILTTPDYPLGYPRSTQCDWIFEMEYDKSIQITFIDIDFETSGNCAYDYIMITNGPDDTYPLLTKTCTKGTKPLTVTSTGNFMYVKFVSDGSYRGKGFWANYTTVATKCGGLFTSALGSFNSPNYPKNYDKKDSCAWLIDIEENHIIELKFGSIGLAGGCDKNFIKVYDGPSIASPVIANLCENSKSNYTIKSSSNQLFVQMVTNDEFTAKGFLANYSTACGARIVTQTTGIINLSEMLIPVQEVIECSWTIISSDPSQHVSLTITHMELYGCYSTEDSAYPVKIYAGESNTAPLIAKFCDERVPPTITSSGNAIHVHVNSVSVKFSAKYSVLDSACGGTLTSNQGAFATPGYPNNYPMNIQCEWILQVAPGNRVSLAFTIFDLVTSKNCHVDYIEIRAGGGHGKLLGTFCSNIPTNITQVGSLWILFKSSRVLDEGAGLTAKGFLAEYTLEHGIDLTGSSGEIASPLYPNYCSKSDPFNWRITVNFSKLITLSFEDFYIESSTADDIYGTALEVFDGYDDNAPTLKRFSGTTIPDKIKSSSNVIYLKFLCNTFGHGSKFFLKWLEVEGTSKNVMFPGKQKVGKCGSDGVIDISNMELYNLTSPGYPFGYAQNIKCEWIFSVPPEYHLEIEIWKMDLENIIAQCLLDTVKIYSGKNGIQDWNLVSTLCFPNASSEPAIITGNLMKVEFNSDSYMNGTGFEGLIRKRCGGSIQATNGIITVDDSAYSCQWNVTVRPGRTMKVEFLQLDMENNTIGNCPNYVVIRNGHYPESPYLGIGKYCTSTIPGPLYTTGNQLYVKFVGQPGNTFKLSYEEVSLACGGTISLTEFEKSVNISSPNYPNVPPAYSECIWTIIAPPAESLRIDFVERFDIMYNAECALAAVELRDGGTKHSSLLGKFCEEMPNTTFSSDNMLYVRFFTEAEEPRNGFKAVISIAYCGGIIRSSEGEVRSPNFNNKKLYPKNINCIWHIVAPLTHYLKIYFDVIDLEYSSTGCRYVDHVAIEERSFLNGTIRTIGDYCGNDIPGEIRSSTNEVFVHLVTGNNQDMLSGFKLQFNSSEEVCGGSLNTESGVIQSPGYPLAYPSRECEWIITVPKGRRITFEFIDLHMNILGAEEGMAFFNDKDYKSSISFTKDLNISTPIKSSSNTMAIYYWGYHHSYRGFQARYSSNEATICSGDFTQESGTIKTINASTYYCSWQHNFRGLASQTLAVNILMTITEIALSSTICINSGIVISSGNDEDNIAKLCKLLKHPLTIRSPYPVTNIVAYQNNYPPKLDYTITYTTHSCGGIIIGQQGAITSPGFPNKQSILLECAWLLKFPADQQIKLTFTNFDLDTTCENNYVVIYNGETPHSPKIGVFCQSNKPVNINSQSNSLWIEYHKNERSTGTGFKLTYEPVINGCGGTFHDDVRIIETPLYPNDYPNNTECLWEIVAKNGYHINLAFINRFYIEESEKCLYDFIEVWDFKDDDWVSLGKHCGREIPLSINSTSNKMKIMFRSNDKIRAVGFMARWSVHCGGTFVADEKVRYIVSPGYPYEYGYNLLCVYKIISSKSHVNIVFEDFLLEPDVNCRYDNLTIHPVTPGGTYIPLPSENKYYCGANKPPAIRQRSDVIITFTTDRWVSRTGFKFRYNTDSCGGIITSPSVINSPMTSPIRSTSKLFYAGAIHCIWNITAPPNKNVMLRFLTFEFEHNNYCSFDSVAVYDGLIVNETLRLALLCGNLTQQLPVVKSRSNQMAVVMKTDYTNHYSGFKALVYFNWGPSAGCGGVVDVKDTLTLEAPTGLDFLDCHWEIITSKDFVLKISFEELNLEKCPNSTTLAGSKNCSCSFIEVRDGGGPFSELIDLWCDNNISHKFTTSANSAWIRLYSFGHTTSKAFKATITKMPSICGQSVLNVTNQTQILTSPLFPQPYPNNIKCTWVLKSSNFLEKFYLRFTEFDLAEMSTFDFVHHKCLSDKVDIADKLSSNVITEGLGTAIVFSGSKSSPVYGGQRMPVGVHQYCGSHALSFDHYSGESEVFVTFTSGANNVHGKGFKMEYQTAGCNRNFTSVQGRLMNSQLRGDCIITITAPENYTISVYFLVFIMYDTTACQDTGFEVHDGNSSAAPLIAKLCGYTIPDPIFSTGNKLWIHLWQKHANNVAFYDATYTSSTSSRGCGGIFYNYVGKFTSPAYPASYRKVDTCVWEIIVPQDTQVALKFTVFDIIGSCINDYVEVITYNTDGLSEVKHHFCKDDNPAVLRSENNRMMVRYITTLNNGGTGWIAQFLAVTADSNLDWLF